MKSDLDELLDMVDDWKFKLYEQIKDLSPEQRIAFWQEARVKRLAANQPAPATKPKAARKKGAKRISRSKS